MQDEQSCSTLNHSFPALTPALTAVLVGLISLGLALASLRPKLRVPQKGIFNKPVR